MANKETVDKVKSLLEGHCYGPLREAAEKWLAVADEKYDIKDKADKAWDKLNDAVDKVVESSGKFNEKMADVSEKVSDSYDKLSEKAAPAIDKLGDMAEKYAGENTELGKKMAEVSDKFGDSAEKIAESELIKQLKEGINSVGDLLETFGADDAKDKFGAEFAEKVKSHAEELKAKGEEFCDCDACRKARSILKDFGEDVKAKAEELKGDAAEKAPEAPAEAPEDEITE
jgi:uncharacterized protein YoxC